MGLSPQSRLSLSARVSALTAVSQAVSQAPLACGSGAGRPRHPMEEAPGAGIER